MSAWERLAELPVEIDGLRLERRELAVSSGFDRVTTTVVLAGAGLEGYGEDVTYSAEDHDGFPEPDLRGGTRLGELAARLDALDLFPARAPSHASAPRFRRYAFESAALDLALRQAGLSLGDALGRPYRPVRFVVSTRLDPRLWLALDPELELKLDPTPGWERPFMAELAATGRVRVLDLKAFYEGSRVENPPDPVLYRALAELFPDAVLEDPALTGEAREALNGAEERFSLDAPVTSLADLDALPVAPRWLNVKPSRFGSLARLLECVEAAEARGIRLYGGGQFELGPGRAQIQALASLLYPDGPNDVAPAGYNEPEPRAGLPRSPLAPPERPVGFGGAGRVTPAA